MAENLKDGAAGPADRLKAEAMGLVGALGDRAMSSVRDRVEGVAGRLTEYVSSGGAGSGLTAAATGAKNMAEGKGPVRSMVGAGMTMAKQQVGSMFGGGKDGKDGQGGGKVRDLKVTNIVESLDVGAPVRLVYDQWTQFADFPSFMKKVEHVQQDEEVTLNWKAQIFWSHRNWESTILEQVPDEKIIWRSKGSKGYVDGAVTFHELAPRLTRVLMVLEYHPQGLFEHTGNIWRAQGRRARLEFKHFRRHVMTELLLHPDEVDGWRGVIRDGEVVQDEAPEDQNPEDEYQDDEAEEAPDKDEHEAQDDEAELDEDRADEDQADEAEEEARPSRRRAAAAERPGRTVRRPPPAGGRGQDRPRDGRPQDGRPQDGRPQDGRPRDGRPRDDRPREERPRRVTRRAGARGGDRS